jgi:hypothetical protein
MYSVSYYHTKNCPFFLIKMGSHKIWQTQNFWFSYHSQYTNETWFIDDWGAASIACSKENAGLVIN